MKDAVLTLLLVGLAACPLLAQPNDGDLIVSLGNAMAYLDPSRPGTMTTLAVAPPTYRHGWTRMASNNTGLVVDDGGLLVQLELNGTATTIATGFQGIYQFELEHDGYWVFADGGNLALIHSSRSTIVFGVASAHEALEGVAIDREPGAHPYVASLNDDGHGLQESADLDWYDRKGYRRNIGGVYDEQFHKVVLHECSGDYVTDSLDSFTSLRNVIRMTRSGRTTRLIAFDGEPAKTTQDNHLWIFGRSGGRAAILKYDLEENVVVTLIQAPFQANSSLRGLEVYGSRRLVCHQQSSTVKVSVQSRKAGDGGKSYALACSFNRRPRSPAQCLEFPNGEYLFLDYTDALFRTTAPVPAPGIFQNFQGTLDQNGDATAQVNIPASLPPNLPITIFVAGVIYDNSGVRTVTNTHWFVLP